MNKEKLIALLQQPDFSDASQIIELEKTIQNYPYFQTVRALYLKGLYVQNSFKYNNVLKETAAFTTDRGVLFDFITSHDFRPIDFIYSDDTLNEVENEVFEKAEMVENHDDNQEYIEVTIEEKLEIGKPLNFDHNEKHSFEEWLKLTQLKPIQRIEILTKEQVNELKNKTSDTNLTENIPEKTTDISKKIAIIDKFIEANPKITPKKEDVVSTNIQLKSEESSMFMTETLAKIYLEQKKYQRAIQAYEILILKYPEKSYFFADRIEDIKKLQQNNS